MRAILFSFLAAISLFLLLDGCGSVLVPSVGEGNCRDACENYSRLGCDEAKPTPAGASCDEVCANMLDLGGFRASLSCVSSADSCERARLCEVSP